MSYPTTPDGRYFVVRGKLWRCTDPSLPEERRAALVHELMDARRALRGAKDKPRDAVRDARRRVQAAKEGLGERGPVWWDDDAPDLTRTAVEHSPYDAWWRSRGGIDD